mgnify:CR=1 FL=1
MILEYIKIIKEFLEIILTWPVAFGVVSLIFIFKFSEEIRKFLNDIIYIKAGGVEAHRQSQVEQNQDLKEKIEENLENEGITITQDQLNELEDSIAYLSKEKEEKDKEVLNKENLIKYYQERAEVYEFNYLSNFLVNNSKQALLWFYKQYNYSSTKENFLLNFTLSFNIPNPSNEKEIIFNVLLVNQLIVLQNGLYVISEKGEKFLKYLELIK